MYNILKELSQVVGFITPHAEDFHITAGVKPLQLFWEKDK